MIQKLAPFKFAIIGATGNVGREILQILCQQGYAPECISAVASDRSEGQSISYGADYVLKIQNLNHFDFKGIDLAFFCTNSDISKKFIPLALKNNCKVIDKSAHFRTNQEVPLVVPEVNMHDIQAAHKLVASPNCVSIPLSMVLNPLNAHAAIKRIVVATYQSVSGAGRDAMDELHQQSRAFVSHQNAAKPQHLPRQIAYNVIPHIDHFDDQGHTGEETKIVRELQKLIGPHIQVAATCVRVPVFIGHSMAVAIEFEKEISAAHARAILNAAPGLLIVDRSRDGIYATPIDCAGEDDVAVSRIRCDLSVKYGILLWICCDNLRKGAALNSVQIAQRWLSQEF